MGRIINLDEYESTGTHWIAFYVDAKNMTYFEKSWSWTYSKLENSLEIKMLNIQIHFVLMIMRTMKK